uniref:Ion_trans_2 domain-containing protein n=1 Tax=Syphacia muris TaxID=451379 RepID=A0A0N5ARI3_9BILA
MGETVNSTEQLSVPPRFTVVPVNEDINYSCKSLNADAAECSKSPLFNYYYNDTPCSDETFDPYSIFMNMYYPLENGGKQSKLAMFKSYWENDSFYAIWRRKFIKEHSCDEENLWREFLLAAVPHLIINVYLTFYIVSGAIIFQLIDDNLKSHYLYEVILFTFTTISTIGYGNLVPTNDASKLFCIFYTLIGVPSLFISLTNIGQFLAEAYWILLASLKKQKKLDTSDDTRLPLPIVILLLLILSVAGGFLFHFWIDQRDIIPAIYFSFVSITTIGFGDIIPTPDGWLQTSVVILYLATGMVVMSTFVAALLNYLRKLHYLGRNFSGAAHVEVWFGGTRMSIAELLHIVASHFEVSPKELYDVLRDLDDIITAATEPSFDSNTEADQTVHSSKSILGIEKKTVGRRRTKFIQIPDSTENSSRKVMEALSMLHHITTTKSNIRNARRASSASCRFQIIRNETEANARTITRV